MIGYSLETRRRVARSPLVAPALTRAQIAKLAPTIIVKRPGAVDERQQRYRDPTIYDLAAMAWHVREARKRTEDLRTPLPGSNLVVSGEVSMPWKQYVRAAVTNQVPGPLRVRVGHKAFEHTIAPCEDHVMVPLGWQSMSRRELLETFTGHRHKYVTQADHIHEVDVRLVEGTEDGKYEWRCRRCDQWGFEPYTAETLGRATGVVWHGCLRCMDPVAREVMARRTFLKLGIAVAGGLSAFVSVFDPLRPIPFVPPAEGAPSTFFVDWASGNDTTGTGATGAPWKTLEKARTNMVASNGDTVKARGSDTAGQRYDEYFDSSHQFPTGSSFAVATTITKDTGHTPTLKPTGAPSNTFFFECVGASRAYTIWDSLIIDGSGADVAVLHHSHSTDATAANGAHHMRVTGCTLRGNAGDSHLSSIVGTTRAHDNEYISLVLGPHGTDSFFGAPTYTHSLYMSGRDMLIQGCESSQGTGYAVHAYFNAGSGDQTQGEPARLVVRRSSFHNASGRGLLLGGGPDVLMYYTLAYDNAASGGVGGLLMHSYSTTLARPQVLNNAIVGNFAGGITNGLSTNAVINAVFKNNISVSNGGGGNFVDRGFATTATNNITSGSVAFVSEAAKNFRLSSSASNAIDQGTSVTSILTQTAFSSGTQTHPDAATTLDYDGATVPVNAIVDIGAFESGASPPSGAGVGGSNPNPWHRGRIRH